MAALASGEPHPMLASNTLEAVSARRTNVTSELNATCQDEHGWGENEGHVPQDVLGAGIAKHHISTLCSK